MKFEPNSKIRTIPFVKPLRETSFPRFSGRGEQLQIRVLGTFFRDRGPSTSLEFCNTYWRRSSDMRRLPFGDTFSNIMEDFWNCKKNT